jgi:hypothetical protein
VQEKSAQSENRKKKRGRLILALGVLSCLAIAWAQDDIDLVEGPDQTVVSADVLVMPALLGSMIDRRKVLIAPPPAATNEKKVSQADLEEFSFLRRLKREAAERFRRGKLACPRRAIPGDCLKCPATRDLPTPAAGVKLHVLGDRIERDCRELRQEARAAYRDWKEKRDEIIRKIDAGAEVEEGVHIAEVARVRRVRYELAFERRSTEYQVLSVS